MNLKTWKCRYCGETDCLEQVTHRFAFRCLLCLRQEDAERTFARNVEAKVTGVEHMREGEAWVVDLGALARVALGEP